MLLKRIVKPYVPQVNPELRDNFRKAVMEYQNALDKFDNAFYVDFYSEAKTEEMRDEYTGYADILGSEVLMAKQKLDSTIKLIKISMGYPTHDTDNAEKEEVPAYNQSSLMNTIMEKEGRRKW